ncbi:MAG TPA: MlaD family protein [Ignavibacteria bacterium]|nr:MlaD family protein [Ignavibacteria bacterium]
MEPKNNKKIAVALFIISGFALFTVAIFIIGSKENLFTPTFLLKSEFTTVSGLKNGSSVRFNGISIGKVDAVDILSTDKVMVTMSLERSVQKYIKVDARATVSSEGLIGNKVIEISPGSQTAPSVQDNQVIVSVKPIEVQDIMLDLKTSTEHASNITKDLQEITNKVNTGQGTLGQLLNNDTLYRSVDGTFKNFATSSGQLNEIFGKVGITAEQITNDIKRLSSQVNGITEDVGEIVDKMNSSESVVGTVLTDTAFANNIKSLIKNADMTTKNLENGSFSFSQNMEALKHNFFFKGYFEDIGYWDKDKSEQIMMDKQKQLNDLDQKIKAKKKELEELEKK